MSQQIINVGTSANDGTGDTLRLSQQKANDNFTELFAGLGGPQNLNQVLTVGNTSTTQNAVFEKNSDEILTIDRANQKINIVDAGSGESSLLSKTNLELTNGVNYSSTSITGISIGDVTTSDQTDYTKDAINFSKNGGVDGVTIIPSITSGYGVINLPDVLSGVKTLVVSVNSVEPDSFGNVSVVGGDYANDASAATGGIAVGGLYHTSGVVKIRLT